MVSINDKGYGSESLMYKPNIFQFGVLKRFLDEQGKGIESIWDPRLGKKRIYHFSGCTIKLFLTNENNLEVYLISDSPKRLEKASEELRCQLMMHEIYQSRQGILS